MLIRKFIHYASITVLAYIVPLGSTTAIAATTGYVLKLNLTPAVCRLDATQKRTRQCTGGYSTTVAGLWPEGVNMRQCSISGTPNFAPVQRRLLSRVMPDENQQIRLWRSVGGCLSMNSTRYFRTLLETAEQVRLPPEVTPQRNVFVNRIALRQRFAQLNRGLTTESLYFSCAVDRSRNIALLTQINICLNVNGNYKPCEGARILTCPNIFSVQAVY